MGDHNTLADFRNELYHCFGNGKDALMNTCDPLLCGTGIHSFPDIRRPWAKSSGEATPSQVRAGIPGIIATLGTPARPAQPRGKSPGRPVGAVINKRPRFKTVFKQAA